MSKVLEWTESGRLSFTGTLIGDLRQVRDDLSEPRPSPQPVQDNREGEAAAAQVDMQAMAAWRERRLGRLERLANMIPDILNKLELADQPDAD